MNAAQQERHSVSSFSSYDPATGPVEINCLACSD